MNNKRHLLTAVLCSLVAFSSVSAHEAEDGGSTFQKFRIGGYGEILANFKDYGTNRYYGHAEGNPKTKRNTISIPRFVLALDYKFTPKWILGAEIEFESGGTGIAYELENSENGEYETEVEKGGEVAIEQFHITRLIIPEFNVRVGHVVLPIGLTNAHHEPINFFGTSRPEGETRIIPSTWHETGVELFGTIGKGFAKFDYQAMVVAGLNANGFNRSQWSAGGKQGFFEEDNFTSPAYLARIDYRGIPGLRIGASYYFCNNIGANTDERHYFDIQGKMPLRIYTVDAQYSDKYLTVRGNCIFGNLGNSRGLNKAVKSAGGLSPYSMTTPVAKRAVSYGAEIGLNLQGITGSTKCPALIPFARYEYYNPQEEVLMPYNAEPREKVSMWTAGLNWRALPNLVFKADYTTRKIGGGRFNSENEFAIGVAYVGWFWSK
ncbi:MAG: hypothetical protein IJZ01_01265 [Paraprevotella sp.]|nr:hypothetical protein [Paraprevotella sp.]